MRVMAGDPPPAEVIQRMENAIVRERNLSLILVPCGGLTSSGDGARQRI